MNRVQSLQNSYSCDCEFINNLVQIISAELPQYHQQLLHAISHQNLEKVQFFSHKLKGAAAAILDERTKESYEVFESSPSNFTPEEASQIYLQFLSFIEELTKELTAA